jgi:hypothetical protein
MDPILELAEVQPGGHRGCLQAHGAKYFSKKKIDGKSRLDRQRLRSASIPARIWAPARSWGHHDQR